MQSMRVRLICYMCDKQVSTLNRDGWCESCEREFMEIKARNKWECISGPCSTPVTCAMKKACCKTIASGPKKT